MTRGDCIVDEHPEIYSGSTRIGLVQSHQWFVINHFLPDSSMHHDLAQEVISVCSAARYAICDVSKPSRKSIYDIERTATSCTSKQAASRAMGLGGRTCSSEKRRNCEADDMFRAQVILFTEIIFPFHKSRLCWIISKSLKSCSNGHLRGAVASILFGSLFNGHIPPLPPA